MRGPATSPSRSPFKTGLVMFGPTLRPNLDRYMNLVLLAYHKKQFVSSPQIFASWHCLIVLHTSSRFAAEHFRVQMKIGRHTNVQIFAHCSLQMQTIQRDENVIKDGLFQVAFVIASVLRCPDPPTKHSPSISETGATREWESVFG